MTVSQSFPTFTDDEAWHHLLAFRHEAMIPPWDIDAPLPDEANAILLHYADLAAPDAVWVIGHLGQTLDGFIADDSAKPMTINHPLNLDHLHRLRALADAIVVGANTVAIDDPQLTTRRVPGPNPVRVVLDRRLSLAHHHRLFTDGIVSTVIVHEPSPRPLPPGVTGIALPAGAMNEPRRIVAALAERGWRRVFVEGGGVTVSRWLAAAALTRLQLTVAPRLIGRGVRALSLSDPALPRLTRVRHWTLGTDCLIQVNVAAA